MAREIIIDADTLIGYNFLLKEFYIENKGYNTYREKALEAKEVLDIVAPDNVVTVENLEHLKDTMETLQALYYTWEDTGAYIKTVQINTYENNPVTLDCEKKKLYVMNSNLIFDLTLNESREYRLLYLISYFADTLGVAITEEEMGAIYDLLYSFYTPTVFNYISSYRNSDDLTDLRYDNEFALSNFNGGSGIEYKCTFNPYNNKVRGSVAYPIVYLDQNANTVQLRDLEDVDNFAVGDTTEVVGAEVIIDEQPFSADGTYTIAQIKDGLLQVQEQIPVSYTTEYLTLYKVVQELQVSSINRETNTITLTEDVPNTIKVGDVIQIKGANTEVENTTTSADGTYTVSYISQNTLTVQDSIPASYTYTTGAYPVLYKKQEVAYIKEIVTNEVTLYAEPTLPLEQADKVEIKNTLYEVYSYLSSDNILTLTNSPEPFVMYFPSLYKQEPETLTKINVTVSNTRKFPVGEFMLDTFEQCKEYIKTCNFLIYPTATTKENLYGKVATTYPFGVTVGSMLLRGLYSSFYKE